MTTHEHLGPIGVVLVVGLVGCSPCDNSIRHSLPSPDSSRVALLFMRSCGAASSGGYHMSILRRREELPAGFGNALAIVDTSSADSRERMLALSVRWLSNSELEVQHSPLAMVLLESPTIEGVTVTVRTASRQDDLSLSPYTRRP